MSSSAISLTGVGKRYTKYDDQPLISSALLALRTRTRRSELWALRNVNFAVEPGESLGVIGRNGSGKTTLLSLLAGITAPSEGRVRVHGRIAPLIAVGVGFHQELTGRENVYVNGVILGLTRRDIDRRLDEIVDFAGLKDFIDTPVKFYSSGMLVRLGFSVAISVEPDVLLVDEVLAVGDLAFQIKCFERMAEIRRSGSTVVVVSHNLNAIRGLCNRAMLIERGTLTFEGEPGAAISAYHEALSITERPENFVSGSGERTAGELVEITSWEILGSHEGEERAYADTGSAIRLRVGLQALKALARPFLAVQVTSESGVVVYLEHNRARHFPPMNAGDDALWEVNVPLTVPTGTYSVSCALHDEDDYGAVLDLGRTPSRLIYVAGRPNVFGLADLSATFRTAGNTEDLPARWT